MQAAIEAADPESVRRLIVAGESPNRYHPGWLTTPLFWAIRRGDADLVTFLLDHGADIEDRADEGESPLMIAARDGQHEIVRLLIDRGAKVRYRTDKGWDALSYAELGGHLDIRATVQAAWRRKKKQP